MTVGERLRMLRIENKMTLEEVGNAIGVARPTIFRYEIGSITNIPPDRLEALSRLFGVSPAYIMGWEDRTGKRLTRAEAEDEPKNDDIRLLIRGLNKLTPAQVEQAKDMFRIMFMHTNPDLFEKENNDDNT